MGTTNLDSLELGGNLTVTGTQTVTGAITYAGDVTLGDAAGDTITINGTTTANAPITVGASDTGHDVKIFGATANKFVVWDETADDLILADAVALQLGGDESTADGFKLEFDGTSTLALNALTANDIFSIGATTSTDVLITSAGGTITLDASADTLAIASIASTLTGTLTVGVDDTGHDVKFFGATASAHLLWDESADNLLLVGTAGLSCTSPTGSGIGYGTGAGGAVTQATNRTTGVTLSKLTGTITTNATSLAAGAAATFTVTNTTVAIGDTIILSVQSGPTTVQTNIRVSTVAAGSFNITVENNHASTADTGAALINYAVIKAVSA